MKICLFLVFFVFALNCFAGLPHKNSSVLATGEWHKIAVRNTGIHKITYEDFSRMGINLSEVNTENIRIFGNGGGMLPESNSGSRIDDLRENSIMVIDGSDGKLDQGDYILFYGESPDKWYFNYTNKLFTHSKNLYSDSTYYFITTDLGPGLRVGMQDSLDTIPNSTSRRMSGYDINEIDSLSLIRSGKTWYGEVFNNEKNRYDFHFAIPSLDTGSAVRVVADVVAQSPVVSKFILSFANEPIDSLQVDATPPESTTIFGRSKIKTTLVLHPHTPLDLELMYRLPTATSKGWLNFIELNYQRYLTWTGSQMPFRDINSIGSNKITEFILTQVNPSVRIWDVTDPGKIKEQSIRLSGDTIKFIIPTDSLREFIAFDGSFYYPVHYSGTVANQNLHANDPATLVIVTHPEFTEEANRLAAFHRAHNKISVLVTGLPDIYNEFASGQHDLTAIRDYMKLLYDKGYPGNEPRYLLLFGDGSYDPKDRIPGNNNRIPTFQSLESLKYTASYVTDDYFGIMGDKEGTESNGTIEIGIGRFPVTTLDEARIMVDKIVHYSSWNDTILSGWRNVITFIADDENKNVHMHQAEESANVVKEKYPFFNVDKIYLDAYPMVSTPAGNRFPDVNKAINEAVAKGSLIINYTGHGGEDGWAEKVLTVEDINSWSNTEKYPVFVTATCEFSRFDNPERFTAGEMIILKPNSGAIAIYSTTRLAFASTNAKLDTSFFQNLLPDNGDPIPKMGDLIRLSKNYTNNNSNLRNFVLLGDPAQSIAYPLHKVITTEINSHPVNAAGDTALGMSELSVKGHIEDAAGNKLTHFNGTLLPKLYDKPVTYRTLGNTSDSYAENFKLQNVILFDGKATISNGEFEFSFIMPKDVSLNLGNGKISYYARNDSVDANGYYDNVIVGGQDPGANPDDQGPDMHLYMDTRDFISGGKTGKNTVFLAYLNDSSGINFMGLGFGHELLAVLDENTTHPVILNDFYEPDMDTYKSGSVYYPLENLENGYHSIRLKAWDVMDNPSEKTISFFVFEQPELSLQQVINYPNPFTDYTTFMFSPAGEDMAEMDVQIQIFTFNGQLVRTIEMKLPNPTSNTAIGIKWDGTGNNGQKLSGGMYLYRLLARGNNGTFAQASQKLVILR